MKKLLTLALSLILAMGALGLIACGGKGGESMTKDEFMAELERREAATFADETLRYETVDCTYVEHTEREISADGTYGITYGDNYAYVRVEYEQAHGVQQRVFGVSAGLLANMPEEILSATKFVKNGDNLEMSYDATMEGVKFTGKCVFDKNGYVIYSLESQSGDGFSGSAEFTVKKYNKAAVAANSLAGKTFKIVSVEEYNDEDCLDFRQDFDAIINSVIEFKADGTFDWSTGMVSIFGTYTVNGNVGTYTQTGWIEDGETEELPVESRRAFDIAISDNGIVLTMAFVRGNEGGIFDMVDCHLNATVKTQEEPVETVVRYEFTSATSDEGYFADSYIELSGDNAAKSYLHGGEYIGTYTLNGDNISIRTYNGSVGIFWDGVIDGDVLTLTAGGIVVVYTKSAN